MANNQYTFLDYAGLTLFWNKIKKIIEDNESATTIAINNLVTRVDQLTDASRNHIISKTYLELKNLKDASQLVPGQQYMITDYKCTTTQSNTRAQNHTFDIIVTADSANSFLEVARASRHNGDTYFRGCNLNAWKIWYCFNNDAGRFAWADDSSAGRGVIYRMIDELGNDCPYDFKNIQYNGSWGYWAYTFNWIYDDSNGTCEDLSVYNHENDEGGYSYAYSNVIGPCHEASSIDYGITLQLNGCVFLNKESFDSGLFYGCHNNTFGTDCYNNTFEDCCYRNTFGDNCWNNTFGTGCCNNSFADECWTNTFNSDCSNNTFGTGCQNNVFGMNCYCNSFGNGCLSITFGENCGSNSFGNNCYYIKFGSDCTHNSFGNSCFNILFKASSSSTSTIYNFYRQNHFGDACKYIVFSGAGTPSLNVQVQNYNFAQGFQGSATSYITIYAERGNDHETTVAKTSTGDYITYCEADFV